MRLFLKRLLFFIILIPNLVPYLLYRLLRLALKGEALFAFFSQAYSLIPGKPGDYCRSCFYWMTLKACSKDVTVSFGTFFPTPDIEIGSYVYIGANCIISKSRIDDDVMLGSNVHVVSGKMTHNFDDIDTPMRLQGGQATRVHIGRNSWVGNSTVIMADIGTGCVVGAGSVVIKDVADYSVAVGNPARVVRCRKQVAAGSEPA
jgi:virginiamycin A acetyltransferase